MKQIFASPLVLSCNAAHWQYSVCICVGNKSHFSLLLYSKYTHKVRQAVQLNTVLLLTSDAIKLLQDNMEKSHKYLEEPVNLLMHW